MKKQDTSYLKFLLPIVFIIQGSTANKPLFSSATTKPIEHVDSLEFPRKKEYLAKRQILILKDQKINFSHAIKLTEKEKKLNALISDIAKGLQKQLATSRLFCPSRNFFIAKKCIEQSPLFPILQRMPKGGLLHVHSSSVGNANWLVKRAIADENCYIYMLDDGSILKGKMNVFSKGKAPKGYELMSALAAQDPAFASQVTDMITLSLEDSLSPNPWIKFESCFERIERILQYAPILKDYYTQAFEDLVLDNIQIIELRTEASKITQLFDLDGKIYSPNEAIALHRNIAEKIREKSPDFMLKLIISDVRTINVSQEQKSLEDAFKLRSKHPDLIVGYDLVGSETTGHKTFYYLDNLLDEAHEFSQKYHTNLPYYFHAGESDWATNENLYDAILLQSKRIGHAFNLFHFPELIKKIKQQNICIEACPISNQILGYITDLRIHPAAGYLKTGLQCILSSDDPMIFRTSGLSYDFWEATMAWNLDLSDIKQLCINSISYSSLDPLEKKKALLSWKKSWEIFIHETLIQLEKKSPYEQGNF